MWTSPRPTSPTTVPTRLNQEEVAQDPKGMQLTLVVKEEAVQFLRIMQQTSGQQQVEPAVQVPVTVAQEEVVQAPKVMRRTRVEAQVQV